MPRKRPVVYWKVITKNRWSIFTANRSLRVKYPVGEWAYPQLEGSKLMVFKRLSAARDFMGCRWSRGYGTYHIVPCHIKGAVSCQNSCIPVLSLMMNATFGKKKAIAFWEKFNKFRKRNPMRRCKATTYINNIRHSDYNSEPMLTVENSVYASAVKCLE